MEGFKPKDIRNENSVLGDNWVPVYTCPVDFSLEHFQTAMLQVIRQPNFNSTVIMRAEIISEEIKKTPWSEAVVENIGPLPIDTNTMKLTVNVDDIQPRIPATDLCQIERVVVRRIIPRNPLRDPVVNQSCLVYSNWNEPERDTMLLAYVPHLRNPEESPFYLPPTAAVGILYQKSTISVHYLLFEDDKLEFRALEESSRILRIALHLVQTAYRHSRGVMTGYEKRVYHDVVVDKVAFQNKYTELKQKYAKGLVEGWAESTDPKKHVFEDLAIAAFLIILWNDTYDSQNDFNFLDLGCGNGLLVHLLICEGYSGIGIDARARKSWATYPEHVQEHIKEQVIIPEILLKHDLSAVYTDKNTDQSTTHKELMEDDGINTLSNIPADKPTFLIGNHSDELTCWIPLFGYPYMVIPCCSHALSGAKARFTPKSDARKSKYAALVDHVVDLAVESGWHSEMEILRIPSTRNAALIGRSRGTPKLSIEEIIKKEGGAEGWIERTLALKGKGPRGH